MERKLWKKKFLIGILLIGFQVSCRTGESTDGDSDIKDFDWVGEGWGYDYKGDMPEMKESLENLAAAALQDQTMMAALTDAVAKLTSKLETQDAEIRRLKSTNNAGHSQNRGNNNPPSSTRTRPDRGVWEANTNYC